MESQNQLPQLHEPAKGTSILRTCFNGINALSGVGILSMPYALSQGGWLSLTLFLSIAILCWYTGLLLQRCMDSNPNTIKTYPDIGHAAFGRKGRALISTFMYLELFLVAVEFLILEGDNLDKLFPGFSFRLLGGPNAAFGGRRGFTLLAALAVLPTAWLRSLGALAYVSAGGVVASMLVVGCVFWSGAFDGVGFRGGDGGEMVNFGGLPTAVSLYLFCYCGHAVFPTLCNSMKDRTQFSKVLIICFAISTLGYGSMAILGYLMFGNDIKSQVTLNLPLKKISTNIAIFTTLINPLTKYALVVTPIANAIEEKYPFKDMGMVISIIIRTLIVLSTTIVALIFPFFGYVMAFTGAFLGINVSVLLPCLFYLKINKSARNFGFELVMIIAIVAIGCFICVAGTYVSTKQIVDHL